MQQLHGDEMGLNFSATVHEPTNYGQILFSPKPYTVTFTMGSPAALLEVKKQDTEMIYALIRYRDILLPTGTKLQFTMSAAGMSDLRYDSDGDGIPETVLPPTVAVMRDDPNPQRFLGQVLSIDDTTAPVITLTTTTVLEGRLVTITATDEESGVRALVYRLYQGDDAHPYTEPFIVDPTLVTSIRVSADDGLANRAFRDFPIK